MIALLTVVASAVSWFIYGHNLAIGIIVGGTFAIVNTMLLANVIKATIKPDNRDAIEIIVTLFLKFPVAIGGLVLILWQGWVDPIGFAFGFTLFPVALLVALTIYHYTRNRTPVEDGGDNC